jgi:hypothetical protein
VSEHTEVDGIVASHDPRVMRALEKVIWSWIAVASTRRCRRELQMVLLCWYVYDHRLATHAGHRRLSPGARGGLGFNRLERWRARQMDGFAMKLASVRS